MNNNSIGDRIRARRKEIGLTQQQLADKLNISLMTVRRFETNARQPKLEMIDKIAVALEVDPFSLAFGIDDKPINYSTTITVDTQKVREALYNNFLNGNDEREKIIKGVSSYLQELRKDTIEKYDSLNAKGKEKANDCITDLTKIDEYTVPDNVTGDKDNE